MHSPLTVRILGAGVAGLAASIALAEDGHHVELIDERFDAPPIGTALGLFGSAQRVLARIGVLEAVQAGSTAPLAGTIRGVDGRAVASLPAGEALLVSRSHLVRTLQHAVPDTVRLVRRRIEDVRPLREGADLLVGADGVHSLVRRSGWRGRTAARSHHMTVLRGIADISPPEISETWGGGWLFGITPIAGHRTNWFACLPEHRTASVSEDLEHLAATVGGHRDPIDAVLAAARPGQTLVHGIHTAPHVHPVRENVVLIGDAAHAMAPNLGHGAHTALRDAEALAASIRDRPTTLSSTASGATASPPPRELSQALRTYALRRALAGHCWRLASGAMMRLAMMDERAGLRDRLLRSAAEVRTVRAP
ncbi:FAD-dependent monooxygenase [Brachybacterium sp. GCM10030252]|uniref:FAD-dependent monooxygenase n=2 Tax=unclassified Brachybacterium TaxID=2623841 RepID=UPI003623F15A